MLAENRQRAHCPSEATGCEATRTGQRTVYHYDGDGRRVRIEDPQRTTVFVYDAAGKLASEFVVAGQAPADLPTGTQYLTADHLGTTRVVTNGAGSIVERRDYRPFGEDILASAGTWRQGLTGYGATNNLRVGFTGQLRDNESKLDYFGARYFSWQQGRFTSPDETLIDQHAPDPQSWNLYAYVRSNPLSGHDPDGHVWHIVVGVVGGYVVGGGVEIAKQMIKGETIDVQKAHAKGINGAIVGGTAALTGGLGVAGAAFTMSGASITGGVVERAIDGDQKTDAFDPKLMLADGVLGAGAGAAGQYAKKSAAEALERTGEFAQKLTRADSFIKTGTKSGDATKVAKGLATQKAAKAEALRRAGDPAGLSITTKQETASEMISVTRQEQLERERRKKTQ